MSTNYEYCCLETFDNLQKRNIIFLWTEDRILNIWPKSKQFCLQMQRLNQNNQTKISIQLCLQEGACFQHKHASFSSLLNRFKWQNNCWLKWKLSKPQLHCSSISARLSLLNYVIRDKNLLSPNRRQNEECPCLRDDGPSLKWDFIIPIIAFIKRGSLYSLFCAICFVCEEATKAISSERSTFFCMCFLQFAKTCVRKNNI